MKIYTANTRPGNKKYRFPKMAVSAHGRPADSNQVFEHNWKTGPNRIRPESNRVESRESSRQGLLLTGSLDEIYRGSEENRLSAHIGR